MVALCDIPGLRSQQSFLMLEGILIINCDVKYGNFVRAQVFRVDIQSVQRAVKLAGSVASTTPFGR